MLCSSPPFGIFRLIDGRVWFDKWHLTMSLTASDHQTGCRRCKMAFSTSAVDTRPPKIKVGVNYLSSCAGAGPTAEI